MILRRMVSKSPLTESSYKIFMSYLTVVQQLLEVGTPIMAKIQDEAIFPLLDYTGKRLSIKIIKRKSDRKYTRKCQVPRFNNKSLT